MRILALGAALAAVAVPSAALSQDTGDYYSDDYETGEYETGEYESGDYEYDAPLSSRLSDPAMQDQLASTVAVLGEIMLDLPLAPIVEPIARATGSGSVDPDMTLRRMNPGASEATARAARELPRAMDAMASMAGSIEAMRPALRDMADRLSYGIEEAREGGY